MSSLILGNIPMAGMKPMGQGLLPPWVTWLWLIALAAVLIFHCGHFARMGGQHRWFHASHILMLISMLYMYASMEFKWSWLSASLQVVIFSLSTAAIVGWMIVRSVQHRSFSFLWLLALIMQAAMVYMWMPTWAPALTWALVVYYALETVAWLGGRLDDSKQGSVDVASLGAPVAPEPAPVRGGTAVGVLHASTPKTASHRAVVVPLFHDSPAARASMAIMAASMGYMFAAMQMMR